jgi:hypothetical protein
MTRFQLTTHDQLSPISGASAWSFENPNTPILLGYTNTLGQLDVPSPLSSYHKIRFIAHGHTARDYSGIASTTPRLLEMTQNHPGSFSGFNTGSRFALWHNVSTDRYFEFTAIGNYRSATGYRKLLEAEHVQYRMPQRTFWYPPSPKVRKPDSGLGKLPPLPEFKWSYLFLRSDTFPTDERWVYVIDPQNKRFRFPGAGTMFVNSTNDTETNNGLEYKLVN